MAVNCTCGARPPDDARFCHKCGRPLYEMPNLEPEPEPLLEPAPLPHVLPQTTAIERDINFRNRAAVRAGLLAAAICSLLILIPLPVYAGMIRIVLVLTAAGFGAVWLYGRRTGEELSVGKGARMGWMTGVFCFVPAAAMLAWAIVTISGNDEFSQDFREQLAAQAGAGMDADEAVAVITSPAGILFLLLLLFLFFTVLPTVGGAMGAKVLEKE